MSIGLNDLTCVATVPWHHSSQTLTPNLSLYLVYYVQRAKLGDARWPTSTNAFCSID